MQKQISILKQEKPLLKVVKPSFLFIGCFLFISRLRQLLSQEEEEYFNLLEQNEETPQQRQEAMKQKAKILKDKREAERLKLVQEKLDQQFRLVKMIQKYS